MTDNYNSFATANVSLNVTGLGGSTNVNTLVTPLTTFIQTYNTSSYTALQKLTFLRLGLI